MTMQSTGTFSSLDYNNMLGNMLAHSMGVVGVQNPFGGPPGQKPMNAQDDLQPQNPMNSPAGRAWLSSLKPEDRALYGLLSK